MDGNIGFGVFLICIIAATVLPGICGAMFFELPRRFLIPAGALVFAWFVALFVAPNFLDSDFPVWILWVPFGCFALGMGGGLVGRAREDLIADIRRGYRCYEMDVWK